MKCLEMGISLLTGIQRQGEKIYILSTVKRVLSRRRSAGLDMLMHISSFKESNKRLEME